MQPRAHSDSNGILNQYLEMNNQSYATAYRLNHELIALYLLHTLRKVKKQTFVLAGSEDLRALLPKLKLEEEGDEAFLLVRPYIHSMAIYCRYENNIVHAYIFDPQNWGRRYYPTRLMVDAIRQHFAASNIALSGTDLQSKNAPGCTAYAITFLEYCRDHGADFFTKYTDYLPDVLRQTGMDIDPTWVGHANDIIRQKTQDILKNYILPDATFDHDRIFSAIREMQGIELPYTHILDHDSMYKMTLSESGDELTIHFDDKDTFLFNNIFIYSDIIYPKDVSLQSSKKLLDDVDGISIICHPEKFTLTYRAKTSAALLAAFDSLQWRARDLFYLHIRQLG